MKEKLRFGKDNTNNLSKVYRPSFFRINTAKDLSDFKNFLESENPILIYDTIKEQLNELIRIRNPQKMFTPAELDSETEKYLSGKSSDEHGVWVYYPWSGRLVHLLDEAEFTEVRTNRNHYKISPEEKELLQTKKVGIIGLSVGQSVALTMAMERSFGELRIADFDTLDLSNLNRIRTGVHNIGISKVVNVAREIAEIDPFLKVECFFEGITENNIDRFLTEGGKLDVLVDECDSLDIKIECRIQAKKHRIPVVMETSDRGLLDVERFDLEERSVFHGLIDHLDVSNFKNLKTYEEKMAFFLPLMGIDNLSLRMKASMLELQKTISTWPQLSSAVTMGGGVVADVVRRILLDELHCSGRFNIDVEDIVRNGQSKEEKDSERFSVPFAPELTFSKIKESIAGNKITKYKEQVDPGEKVIAQLVEAAVSAPSSGNNQPWKFFYSEKMLFLFHDKHFSLSFGDYNNFASYITFGAVIENIRLKALQLGLEMREELFPLKDSPLIAIFRFFGNKVVLENEKPLVELSSQIFIRHTNRAIGERVPLREGMLNKLIRSVEEFKDVKIHFAQDQDQLKQLSGILGSADKLRFLHPQCHYEFFSKEIRWTRKESEETRDGLDLSFFNVSIPERAALNIARDWTVVKYLKKWKLGSGFGASTEKAVNAASAIGVVTIPTFSDLQLIETGRAVERMWLTATKENIGIQPLFSLPSFIIRAEKGQGEGMDEDMKSEVRNLKDELLRLLPSVNGLLPVFLFRVCLLKSDADKSLRKEIKNVFAKG